MIGTATTRIDTIVIGGGQAGLSVGYHLKRLGIPFAILDASSRVGDAWRNRWDSLRVFTPAKFAGLDGLPFPAPPDSFPTKDAVADYLAGYAARFDLPVCSGARVTRLSRAGDRFLVVTADERRFEAAHVVVAMGNFQRPRVPAFAAALDADVVQLHSSAYRNTGQLRPGAVLVVGAGNSGAEIACEAARAGHQTWLAGPDVGHVPFRIDGLAARLLLTRLVLRVLFHRIFTVATPIGRRVRVTVLHAGAPLIRLKPADIAAAGVHRLPRVAHVTDGRPVLADGRVIDAANVVWCTGFDPGFSWIDLPVFDPDGSPRHDRGISPDEPGLFFVGLHFLYAFSSEMIHGVGRDAARVAEGIARGRAAEIRAA
jgi:putative flavoprotein involved in K+ transport